MVFHPFYMVEKSPWPKSSSISALCLALGFINYFNNYNYILSLLALIILILSSF